MDSETVRKGLAAARLVGRVVRVAEDAAGLLEGLCSGLRMMAMDQGHCPVCRACVACAARESVPVVAVSSHPSGPN